MHTVRKPGGRKRPRLRRALRLLAAAALLWVLNWVVASRLLWGQVDALADAMADGYWPFTEQRVRVSLERMQTEKGELLRSDSVEALWDGERFRLHVDLFGKQGGVAAGDTARAWLLNDGRGDFEGAPSSLPETRVALAELAALRNRVAGLRRLALSVVGHPLLTGVRREGGQWVWKVRMRGGRALLRGGWIEVAEVSLPGSAEQWSLRLEREERPPGEAFALPDNEPEPVPAKELDAGLAEGLRILALQAQPVRRDADGEWTEGRGRLRVRDGRRQAYFEGSAYEIGYQHGALLAESARRLMHRTLYGIGLYYSLTQNEWFPAAARTLFLRQRPFIDESILEEMRGFADGSGIPLDVVRAANLFPEFFHCSGAAVFGKASADGELYHARVLDYMVHIGLQDEALVAAIRRDGAIPFVTVGYAGLIGSVTGMNAEGVAIGEMGGSNEGEWDGVPMSFLMRGVLEHASTLEEAVAYMRDRPRTCEFYYVISDAKGPDAVGIHATPDRFDTVRPGEAHPRLPEPVEDAVLLSSGRRYRHLVERVREHYGRIDAALLFEICRRPVAMKDNLHNVIFEPGALRLWVADAGRHTPACDNAPVIYTWEQLFPEKTP